MPHRRYRYRYRTRGPAMLVLAATALMLAVWSPGAADAAGTVKLTGRLAGRGFPAGAGNPIRLSPDRPTPLEVEISNDGTQAVEVRTITLSGRVTALTFFSYQTSVAFTVPARSTVTRSFSLDLAGLKYQAAGLFNARITLLDQKRRTIGSRPTAVDVRGSWRSVYVVFALILAIGTVASFLWAVYDLARHRLSVHRWRRGLRFLIPGMGLGLTLIFTLSATRFFLAGPLAWLPIFLICTALLFAVGYLTPIPDAPDAATSIPRPREHAAPVGAPRS